MTTRSRSGDGRPSRGVRTAIGIASLAAVIPVTLHSYGAVAARGNPETALALAPWNSRAQAQRAEDLLPQATDPGRLAAVASHAMQAVRRDSTSVSGVATLALVAGIQGREKAAAQLMGAASRLSRRDLRTHIWILENAVAQGDIGRALAQYDLALRTSKSAGALLFPVLGQAIADPAIRTALVRRYVDQHPLWGDEFLQALIVDGPIVPAADFIADLRRAGYGVSVPLQHSLIIKLVNAGEVERAWRRYGAIHPGADRDAPRSWLQATRIDPVTPFDWNLRSDADGFADIEQGARGRLVFDSGSGLGSVLAQQLQLLRPGRYAVTVRTSEVSGDNGVAANLRVTCRDGARLGDLPISAGERSRVGRMVVTIPEGCASQWLQLVGSDLNDGVSRRGVLDAVTVTRVG